MVRDSWQVMDIRGQPIAPLQEQNLALAILLLAIEGR